MSNLIISFILAAIGMICYLGVVELKNKTARFFCLTFGTCFIIGSREFSLMD